MRHLRFGGRLVFGLFLALHGLAHLPAVLGAWGLATVEDASPRPNVVLNDAADVIAVLLGATWLGAATLFVIAGLGVLRRAGWWPPVATAAALASLAMTALWWEDAVVGLVINAAVVAVLGVLLARSVATAGRSRPLAP